MYSVIIEICIFLYYNIIKGTSKDINLLKITGLLKGIAMNKLSNRSNVSSLSPYLSPISAWALAFGCSVGWGAFVMPATTFLPIAGPIGSLLGLIIGAGVMLIIGINYSSLMRRNPCAGGAYTYASSVLGGDHGFL